MVHLLLLLSFQCIETYFMQTKHKKRKHKILFVLEKKKMVHFDVYNYNF